MNKYITLHEASKITGIAEVTIRGYLRKYKRVKDGPWRYKQMVKRGKIFIELLSIPSFLRS